MELTQDVSILLRVAAAMLFGGVLGVEREMGKHAAGLRTHMLIAGAAALIVALATRWPSISSRSATATCCRLIRCA
nr:MgtC/SapB family protein [uncultured Stenotrophomonas sp.]